MNIPGVQRIRHLRDRHVHHRFAVQSGIPDVRHHADNLPWSVLQSWPHALADDDEISYGVGVHLLPVLLQHGAVDQHHSGRLLVIVIVKQASSKQADSKRIEVAGRYAAPSGNAVITSPMLAVLIDRERHSQTRRKRKSARTCDCRYTRDAFDSTLRASHEFGDLRGFFKLRTRERHLQCEDVLLVESATDRPRSHEAPDEKAGTHQQHQR